MAEENILNGDIKKLSQIAGDIKEHNAKKDRLDRLKEGIKDLSKELDSLKKSKSDEIEKKIKDSTDAISLEYDKSIAVENEKAKQIQIERDKAKQAGVKERIARETAYLREKNEGFEQEISNSFSQEAISRFCNSKLFIALYSSRSVADYVIYGVVLLLLFVAIPCGIYFIPAAPKWILLIYFGIVAIGVCILNKVVYRKIFMPHADTILLAQDIRQKINKNKQKIKKIEKGIKADKNEDMYGLESFDEQLDEQRSNILAIEQDRQSALDEFEKTAKADILSEIDGRYDDKISKLEKDINSKAQEVAELEDIIQKQRIYITSNYETYLGKEFMSIEKIDELYAIMKSGAVDTISQALFSYKSRH